MKNIRYYGQPPYSIAVLHGGPGAPGTAAPIAKGLSDLGGTIEPLQSADTVLGQIEELNDQLKTYDPPFVLVGHSWGALLAWIYASAYPKMVKHIILVSCPPFDDEYASEIMNNRMNNLESADREKAKELIGKMETSVLNDDEFNIFGELMSKSDAYCEVDSLYEESPLQIMPEVYEKVWAQAAAQRSNGELLNMAEKIECKISFIHGKQDPHPYEGIQDVLNEYGVDFEFILMDRCGHTPWKEKFKAKDFFNILRILVAEQTN